MCSLIFSFLLEYVMRTFYNHDFVGIPFVLEWLLSKSWDKDYKGRYSTSIFLLLIIFIFISIFSARLSNFRIAWNSKPTTHLSLRRPVENHWLSATKNCRDPLWNNLFCYGATFLCPYLFWSECVFYSVADFFCCCWKSSSGWLQCCSENWKEQLTKSHCCSLFTSKPQSRQ